MGLPTSFGKKKDKSGKRSFQERSQDGQQQTQQSSTTKSSSKPANQEYHKYYAQRFLLFSLYDYGVMMDDVGWYSVTPEEIAVHVAKRCACDVIIDAFCGVGGNAIQFAKTCQFVIAIDIDPVRLACARHNAMIYGVADKIDFILGDYMTLIPKLKANVVYIAPPWGGPNYVDSNTFDIKTMIPMDGEKLYRKTKSITPNICFCLPKNISFVQVAGLANLSAIEHDQGCNSGDAAAGGEEMCEIEQNVMGQNVKMVTAYYGNLVTTKR
eukprot:CAMPEP_0175151316 /NCGR_PEP_ID=MMETSP0087-20121206/18425_1 /TAXON_ID=136419 /ORGANISM="Unknown Unknown, Strain D1" /LENGTH=267 /DNA_ID=CAMNT_0016437493 /DNA_START=24 /DNA_END=827 /DNA_ORIENTATION=-